MSVNTILDSFKQVQDSREPILIVDDERSILEVVGEMLASQPYDIYLAESLAIASRIIKEKEISIVLTDLLLDDGTGIDVLTTAQKYQPDVKVILMTGKPTIQNAISAIKKGASDYLVKPFKMEDLLATVERSVYQHRLEQENIRLNEIMSFYAISEAMGSVIETDKLLNLILDTAVREFNADYAVLHLVHADGNISAQKNVCKDPSISQSLNRFSQELAESVNQRGKPRIVYEKEAFAWTGLRAIKSSICQLLVAKGKTIGMLSLIRTKDIHQYTTGHLTTLSLFASKAALSIENSKLYQDLEEAYFDTVEALASAIEARDQYTAGHTNRVWKITMEIARTIGWQDSKIKELRMGAVLHDIGKIGVPDAILNKQGPLTNEEHDIMKIHPEMGVRMVEKVNFLKPALPYILYHHERWDGNGYPQSFKGEEIPVEGRLLSVVDTFDAITSDRPYRKGRSVKEAVAEIKRNSGTQFDPAIVDAFIKAIGSIDFDQL
ncbi:MAG: response regulator [candidate division Zixibacteria bacterium]|nr:response regulator [candidate division Zixibacteria bacterium]